MRRSASSASRSPTPTSTTRLDGPAISEEEHEVTLRAEEPVVEKRTVPKERVRLEKDVETERARGLRDGALRAHRRRRQPLLTPARGRRDAGPAYASGSISTSAVGVRGRGLATATRLVLGALGLGQRLRALCSRARSAAACSSSGSRAQLLGAAFGVGRRLLVAAGLGAARAGLHPLLGGVRAACAQQQHRHEHEQQDDGGDDDGGGHARGATHSAEMGSSTRMPDLDTVLAWRGKTIVDRDGEKAGTLGALYLDDDDRPAYGGVQTGLFRRRESMVPLDGARVLDDDVQVPYTARADPVSAQRRRRRQPDRRRAGPARRPLRRADADPRRRRRPRGRDDPLRGGGQLRRRPGQAPRARPPAQAHRRRARRDRPCPSGARRSASSTSRRRAARSSTSRTRDRRPGRPDGSVTRSASTFASNSACVMGGVRGGVLSPGGRHIGAALFGDARTDLHERRVRRELPGEQRLAEPEAAREVEQAGRDEPEELTRVREVRGGVQPHQHEVVALREHIRVHLLRTLRGGE